MGLELTSWRKGQGVRESCWRGQDRHERESLFAFLDGNRKNQINCVPATWHRNGKNQKYFLLFGTGTEITRKLSCYSGRERARVSESTLRGPGCQREHLEGARVSERAPRGGQGVRESFWSGPGCRRELLKVASVSDRVARCGQGLERAPRGGQVVRESCCRGPRCQRERCWICCLRELLERPWCWREVLGWEGPGCLSDLLEG